MNKNDVLFIMIILILAGAFYFITTINKDSDSNKVLVTLDGRLYGAYNLNEDRELNIENDNGHNLIIIRNGKVHVEDADCQDKYCVNQREISKNGESIICLPHKLVIETVRSGDNTSKDIDNDIDSVAK